MGFASSRQEAIKDGIADEGRVASAGRPKRMIGIRYYTGSHPGRTREYRREAHSCCRWNIGREYRAGAKCALVSAIFGAGWVSTLHLRHL
jgi:hypothetical protein